LASVEVSIRERVRFFIQNISANWIYALDTGFQSMVTILSTDEFMFSFTFLILHILILICRNTLTILVVTILIWEKRVIGYCIAYNPVWKVLVLNFYIPTTFRIFFADIWRYICDIFGEKDSFLMISHARVLLIAFQSFIREVVNLRNLCHDGAKLRLLNISCISKILII